jgi:hypothetical protein
MNKRILQTLKAFLLALLILQLFHSVAFAQSSCEFKRMFYLQNHRTRAWVAIQPTSLDHTENERMLRDYDSRGLFSAETNRTKGCEAECKKLGYETAYLTNNFSANEVYISGSPNCVCANVSGCQRACKIRASGIPDPLQSGFIGYNYAAVWNLFGSSNSPVLQSVIDNTIQAENCSYPYLRLPGESCTQFSNGKQNCIDSTSTPNTCAAGASCGLRPHAAAWWEMYSNGYGACVGEIITSDLNSLMTDSTGKLGITLSVFDRHIPELNVGSVLRAKTFDTLPPAIAPNRYRVKMPLDPQFFAGTRSSLLECRIDNSAPYSPSYHLGEQAAKSIERCDCPVGLLGLLKGYNSSSIFVTSLRTPNEASGIVVTDEFGKELFPSSYTAEQLEAEYLGTPISQNLNIASCLQQMKEYTPTSRDTGYTTKAFTNSAEIKAGVLEYYTILDRIGDTKKDFQEKIDENSGLIEAFNNDLPNNSAVGRAIAYASQMWAYNQAAQVLLAHHLLWKNWKAGAPGALEPWIVAAANAYMAFPRAPTPIGGDLGYEFFDTICRDHKCVVPSDVLKAAFEVGTTYSQLLQRNANIAPYLEDFKSTNVFKSSAIPTDSQIKSALKGPAVSFYQKENDEYKRRIIELTKVASYLLCPSDYNRLEDGMLERVVGYLKPLSRADIDSFISTAKANLPADRKWMRIELAHLLYEIDLRRDLMAFSRRIDKHVGTTLAWVVGPQVAFSTLVRLRIMYLASRPGALEAEVYGAGAASASIAAGQSPATGAGLGSVLLSRLRKHRFAGDLVALYKNSKSTVAELAHIAVGLSDVLAYSIGIRKILDVASGTCDQMLYDQLAGTNSESMEPYLACMEEATQWVAGTHYYTALTASVGLQGLRAGLNRIMRTELANKALNYSWFPAFVQKARTEFGWFPNVQAIPGFRMIGLSAVEASKRTPPMKEAIVKGFIRKGFLSDLAIEIDDLLQSEGFKIVKYKGGSPLYVGNNRSVLVIFDDAGYNYVKLKHGVPDLEIDKSLGMYLTDTFDGPNGGGLTLINAVNAAKLQNAFGKLTKDEVLTEILGIVASSFVHERVHYWICFYRPYIEAFNAYHAAVREGSVTLAQLRQYHAFKIVGELTAQLYQGVLEGNKYWISYAIGLRLAHQGRMVGGRFTRWDLSRPGERALVDAEIEKALRGYTEPFQEYWATDMLGTNPPIERLYRMYYPINPGSLYFEEIDALPHDYFYRDVFKIFKRDYDNFLAGNAKDDQGILGYLMGIREDIDAESTKAFLKRLR